MTGSYRRQYDEGFVRMGLRASQLALVAIRAMELSVQPVRCDYVHRPDDVESHGRLAEGGLVSIRVRLTAGCARSRAGGCATLAAAMPLWGAPGPHGRVAFAQDLRSVAHQVRKAARAATSIPRAAAALHRSVTAPRRRHSPFIGPGALRRIVAREAYVLASSATRYCWQNACICMLCLPHRSTMAAIDADELVDIGGFEPLVEHAAHPVDARATRTRFASLPCAHHGEVSQPDRHRRVERIVRLEAEDNMSGCGLTRRTAKETLTRLVDSLPRNSCAHRSHAVNIGPVRPASRRMVVLTNELVGRIPGAIQSSRPRLISPAPAAIDNRRQRRLNGPRAPAANGSNDPIRP
jgi:hypothetical protein